MLVKSTRFGDLDVEKANIIKFPHGLPGFTEEKGFVLLPCQDKSPFAFLQSTVEPNLAFLVVDPFVFYNDYEFKLEDDLAQELGLSAENLPQVINIVTVPDNVEQMTANILAPIIINVQDKVGVQIVLEKSSYTTKQLLFPQGLPNKSGKGGK